MPDADASPWSELARQALARYEEPLLRQVAGGLFRPRNQWPAEELIQRSVDTLTNAPVIDRRLRELPPATRQLLALLAHSRQPRWRVGSLVELLIALGHPDGLAPVKALLEAGLLYPVLPAGTSVVKSFDQWLTQASGEVFVHPEVAGRALGEDLGLPTLPHGTAGAGAVHEADGLEWPLRLAALWQLALAGPFRRTQQGEFFKRDFDRLQQDPLLNAPPVDSLADLPYPGLLAVALAQTQGVVEQADGEVRAGTLPAVWDEGLPATLASLWAALPRLESWTPNLGRSAMPGNPYPAAYLLALLLLARLPADAWADPRDVETWLREHHPFWSQRPAGSAESPGIALFLLGLAYQLRLLEAVQGPTGDWLVRLTPLGRWALGLADAPPATTTYAQTLLVQPNLEVLAYRQGLTPGLIARFSRFATWKSFGAACTLQLGPETVYRALESGLSFEAILQTLEQHGTRATPAAVVESLRTWADKRERITVYPSAALFEFASADDLNEALARGLPATRLSERLAAVAAEAAVDFRHFRLTGTRDYALPPERCVEVDPDGITLAVDLARSDLLLETELQRFAEALDGPSVNGKRRYRLTPASLAAGRDSGLGVQALDGWFQQRTGQGLSPAARLLLTGAQASAPQLRRQLVLHVRETELADGLQQWPGTRSLIAERLGPTALAVAEEHVEELRKRLEALGVTIVGD